MKVYKVIGVMSGTSLDGLDMAYCHIWKTLERWNFDLKASKAIAYPNRMEKQLKESIRLPSEDLLAFHNSYGTWIGKQLQDFIKEEQLEVDFIASHGHTVHHQPDKGITLQIGSGQHIANSVKKKVICDFRTNDVALGGQGAPLVPIGDQLFFGNYDFCLNLGGISNVSFHHKGKRVAYDIGLANMVLNYITKKINLNYDAEGKLARSGVLNVAMYNQLNTLAYYHLDYPKSTGYEWFLNEVVPIVEAFEDTIANKLHTSVHHICEQIALQVAKYADTSAHTLLTTGGGALNLFLIQVLKEKLPHTIEVVVPERSLIEFKEAIVFALMGTLRIAQETNILSSVTGATQDSSSGVVFLPTI